MSDARQYLGEPRGYGRVKFSGDHAARSIWFYEYAESDGKKIDLDILLLFFDRESYDGHLWFSSFELIKNKN